MLTHQIALVSETDKVSLQELLRVSAALQKQAMRDLGPIWDVRATIDAFASLEDVPVSYWPLIIVDDVPDAAGIHLDEDGQPYALAEAGPDWSLTASHEALEMLVDPWGNRVVAGPSPKNGQGRVEFLVEVADPSEDAGFGYTVNGILVSDFYTPHYFDPVAAPAVRYSFTQAIEKPRQVLRGGYLSWHEPTTNHWWQQQWFGARPRFVDLGVFNAAECGTSIRAWIYGKTTQRTKFMRPGTKRAQELSKGAKLHEEPAAAKAKSWRRQIAALKS